MGKLTGLLGAGIGLAVELSNSKAPPAPARHSHDSTDRNPQASSFEASRTASMTQHQRSFTSEPTKEYGQWHGKNGISASSIEASSPRSEHYQESSGFENGTHHNDGRTTLRKRDNDRTSQKGYQDCKQQDETEFSMEPPSYETAIQSKGDNAHSRSSSARGSADLYQRSGKESVSRSALGSDASRENRYLSPSSESLQLPVIVPQRRPEDKSRGWMLCYAPMLESCGIPQQEFLEFLTSFNEASKSSPYLDAVNVAAMGVGFVPGIAPMVVSMAVPIAVKYAKTAQTNAQTSSYLGRANKALFAPHGLFAMVVTFKPESASQVVSVNISSPLDAVRQYGASRVKQLGSGNSTGTTNQAAELPTAAPLIHPSAEELPCQYKNKFQRTCYIAGDYFDRRARASYATDHPEAQMALGPGQQFKSVFGDPNSAAHSGGLKGLLTGGLMQSGVRGQVNDEQAQGRERNGRHDRSRDRRGRNDHRRNDDGSSSEDDHQKRRDNSRGGLIGSAKSKLMKKDLLYLMIVNLPASDQMPM